VSPIPQYCQKKQKDLPQTNIAHASWIVIVGALLFLTLSLLIYLLRFIHTVAGRQGGRREINEGYSETEKTELGNATWRPEPMK
jgi:LPXTG-motif cell wall-anchored protein